jgi:hypothetical protein
MPLPRHSTVALSHAVALLLTAAEALACPDCPTAQVVRASVFDSTFWTHLAQISTPLVVIAGIVARLYRIGLEPRGKGISGDANPEANEVNT